MFTTIRSKLLASFGCVLLLMSGLGITVYTFVEANNQRVTEAIERDFNGSVLIAKLAVEAQKIRRFEKEYFIYVSSTEKAKKYQDEWKNTAQQLRAQLDTLLANPQALWSETERNEFKTWQAGLTAYEQGFDKVIADVQRGIIKDTTSANTAISEAKDQFRVLLDGAAKVGEFKLASARAAQAEIVQRNRLLTRVLAATVGGSLAFCLILTLLVPASIIKPITRLSEAAAAMSTGNLDQQVPAMSEARDFMGLAETLERMRISLKVMLGRLSQTESIR
ncbi:MAG: MCP four helix bundle domain-containing protein [Candidatus Tectimicrobiota bacterium]